jgi:hypothetical protein
MTLTRRYFIRSVGIAVASLVMARCIPSGGKDDSPPGGKDDSPRGRLRHCWLRLDWLAQQAREISSPEKYEQSEQARDELFAEHRAALDDLVAAGELDAGVSDQMQVAFAEAAFHVWRSNAPITCYEALPVEYVARDDLIQQAELLREAASDLDPAVVEEVQAAIARDIAFLEAAAGPEAGLELIEQFESGEIEASPEAIEAARFLVDLLLGETT